MQAMFSRWSLVEKVAAGAVALLLLALILLGVSFCSERDRARRAQAEGRVATGQANAAQGAIETQAKVQKQFDVIESQSRANQENIRNADNYDQDAGDAGDRLSRALCSRVQYKSDPRCAGLS